MTKGEARLRDDTTPCVGCGLCCDGTLYVRAQVTPGEEPRLTEHGLELTIHEDRTFFLQPCPHQSCGRCTIYKERFDICRSFRCALLRRYQAGEIDLSEARLRIDGALKLLEEIRADYPLGGRHAERRRIRRQLADELQNLDQNDRAPVARRLLRLVSADCYFDRWFRDEKDHSERELDTSGSNSLRKTPTAKAQVNPPRKII
jgi:hypothetical protein